MSTPPAPLEPLDLLGPGVQGYTVEAYGATYVPLVLAERPGSGDVGRWLDSLSPARSWRFPNVLNARLAGMLKRRGFLRRREWAADYGEWVEVWERPHSCAGAAAVVE